MPPASTNPRRGGLICPEFVLAVTAAMTTCGLMLVGGTSAANAQDVSRLTQVVPMSGTVTKGGSKGKQFTGTYTIERFVDLGRQALLRRHAQGQGRQARRSPRRTCASRPPSPTTPPRRSPAPAPARSRRCRCRRCPPATPARSSSLDLGPINLNVLGLVIRTNQIQLRIDAVQGPGNLLGNLLCGITGHPEPGHGRHAGGEHAARPARPDPQRAARPAREPHNRVWGGAMRLPIAMLGHWARAPRFGERARAALWLAGAPPPSPA